MRGAGHRSADTNQLAEGVTPKSEILSGENTPDRIGTASAGSRATPKGVTDPLATSQRGVSERATLPGGRILYPNEA
jgi:hypothetical protein